MNRNIRYVDFTLLFLFLVIAIFGVMNVYSVSPESGQKQFIFLGIGLVVGLSLFFFNSVLIESMAYIGYVLGILLLAGVLVFGTEIKGAKSWYVMGPFSLQPVELVKIFTSLALAALISSSEFDIKDRKSVLKMFAIIGIPIILILLQPDVGSILVFCAFYIALYREGFSGLWFVLALYIGIVFLFSINFPAISVVIGLVVLLALFIIIGILFLKLKINRLLIFGSLAIIGITSIISFPSKWVLEHLPEHQRNRITVLFQDESDKAYRDNVGYNLLYSKSAIAVGRVWGTGYNQGTVTKGKFVPEQHTDYIFCTVGEEWGFIGSSILIFLYAFFIIRIFYVAENSKTKFLRIFGYCFGGIVFMHFLINLGMVLGLFPTVGIPLPYFSYGGSSLVSFTLLFFIYFRLVYADNKSLV